MNAFRLGLTILASALAASPIVACSDAGPEAGAGGNAKDESTALPGQGADGGNVIETATGLPCEVDAILKTRCQTCHAAEPKYGASAPLVTWQDLQKPGPGGSASKKVF